MIPLLVTAATPHGVATSRPWGAPLDALLSSVLWHRRKWEASAAGNHLAYHPDLEPEAIELPSPVAPTPTAMPGTGWPPSLTCIRAAPSPISVGAHHAPTAGGFSSSPPSPATSCRTHRAATCSAPFP